MILKGYNINDKKAKGTGGDLPMAGFTFRSDFADKLEESSQPGTFTGNALSPAVCMTNTEILTGKNYDLIGRAARLGNEVIIRLKEALKEIKIIGDIRGVGYSSGWSW